MQTEPIVTWSDVLAAHRKSMRACYAALSLCCLMIGILIYGLAINPISSLKKGGNTEVSTGATSLCGHPFPKGRLQHD